MFHAAGLEPPPPDQPWTWRQLIEASSKLANKVVGVGSNTTWGCNVRALGPEVPIWQAGGDVLSADGEVLLEQPAAVRGVSFWRDLEAVYHLDPVDWPNSAPRPDTNRPYRIALSGGNVAATTFEAPAAYDVFSLAGTYTPVDIAKHWEDGLGFAPVPAGLPGGAQPVTKIEMILAGGISADSKNHPLAFTALRALEAALGPRLVVSASPPYAVELLTNGSLDTRLAPALRWGLQAGRASLADLIGALGFSGLIRVLPSIQGLPPGEAFSQAAQQLRCQLDSSNCTGGTGGSNARPSRSRP
jgi:ABC-type glycerol-3-phosphate transport system substrate-binding protein